MADVVRRADASDYYLSVSENEQDYPRRDWLWDPPSLRGLLHVPRYYLKIVGEDVAEMDAAEKSTVDARLQAEARDRARAEATARIDASRGVPERGMIHFANKRDNYLLNRIAELQAALAAMKASLGPDAGLRNAIPGSFLPTAPRPLPAAIQDYKDDVNSGAAD